MKGEEQVLTSAQMAKSMGWSTRRTRDWIKLTGVGDKVRDTPKGHYLVAVETLRDRFPAVAAACLARLEVAKEQTATRGLSVDARLRLVTAKQEEQSARVRELKAEIRKLKRNFRKLSERLRMQASRARNAATSRDAKSAA